ncbi:4-hydroxy-tetrahydrodipicolinate synthase [Anaerorudis cellulosivorans]|uniref:4-hydroxy-tetrahydrodipicolinate synthase n=1 Tax=Anaerorudis cellulosivorans TaxID=3397862 RepID=UPI00221E482E|nr:4-hydroxy-tetrahydrodipicolinate synthase [Seramator thermalis]MCW1735809.1 4-hydroxy-tetrahydrodipicolinate synthase [Seramator thermalis]
MLRNKFSGMGVALVTPFKKNKEVDFEALQRLIDYQLSNGTDYIVALGTTAETPTLKEKEREEIVRRVVKQVDGEIPIIMGVGGNNTAQLVHTLNTFDFTGVSAILSVTPYYNKPTQEGLFQHYRALSEASPLPIILYNVPGRTGVNLLAETTLRIARECKNVIAIKEASGNMEQINRIIADKPEGFSVISGDDSMTLPIIKAGGIGVISVLGNAFPKQFVKVVHSALNGNMKEAEQDAAVFSEMIRLLFVDGNPAGVKCMLYEMGFIENELRLPLVPVSDETAVCIRKEISTVEE